MSALAPSTNRFTLRVVHNLKYNTTKCATGSSELPTSVGVAFAAHKQYRLAIPVLHEVKFDATGKGKGYPRKGEEPVTEVDG